MGTTGNRVVFLQNLRKVVSPGAIGSVSIAYSSPDTRTINRTARELYLIAPENHLNKR